MLIVIAETLAYVDIFLIYYT